MVAARMMKLLILSDDRSHIPERACISLVLSMQHVSKAGRVAAATAFFGGKSIAMRSRSAFAKGHTANAFRARLFLNFSEAVLVQRQPDCGRPSYFKSCL